MNNSLIPAIKELERVYDLVAEHYKFVAPRPIITIQTKGRSKCCGWHWKEKWADGKISLSEINICAEVINEHAVQTLIHEMCHHHNAVEGIIDCNSASQYHNKRFKERAEMYGLNCEKAGRFGWAMTTLGEELKKFLTEIKVNNEVFNLIRKETERTVAPTKMKKWSCGCTNLRVAVELNATCNSCNKKFEKQEEEE